MTGAQQGQEWEAADMLFRSGHSSSMQVTVSVGETLALDPLVMDEPLDLLKFNPRTPYCSQGVVEIGSES